ncbi:MAG: hypothetical protein WAW86_06200 [Gammaproteobacteria bacterium]
MLKKLTLVLLCAASFQSVAMTTCPSISELRNNQLQGWTAYNSDSGEELPTSLVEQFEKRAAQFLMAEWADEAPEGTSHCYYGDKNGEYMDAFLAKHDYYADTSVPAWKNESGFLRCHADAKQCPFVERPERK